MIAIDLSNVDAVLVELGQHVIWGSESGLFDLDGDSVKVVISISCELHANYIEGLHKDLGHKSSLDCHLFKPELTVPLHVERCHVGEKSLSSTDVTGGLISSNVLLSGLEGHSECLIAVHIL
jgi:hypothetical protein